MSCGTPALVPAAQGFQDTVTHGVTGYHFKPRDIKDAMQCAFALRDRVVATLDRNCRQTSKKPATHSSEGVEYLDTEIMLAAGAEMTIEGCSRRAQHVYDDAIATNEARSVLFRLILAVIILPLACIAAMSQQVCLLLALFCHCE